MNFSNFHLRVNEVQDEKKTSVNQKDFSRQNQYSDFPLFNAWQYTNFFKKKQPSTPFKKVHVNPKKPAENRPSKIVVKDKTQQQIDEILDKISQSGYDSLTAEEKEFLFRAGK